MFARRISKSAKQVALSQSHSLYYLISAAVLVLGVSMLLDQKPLLVLQDSNSATPDRSHPNIVLITMDTVRADHLSLYGYERSTTPKLQAFSQEACLYTHAIAPGDMTLPTHASIFTGLYARRHGAHYNPPHFPWGRPLADRFKTVAQILSEKGYFNIGVVANNSYLTHDFGLDRGFHYYDQRAPVPFLGNARSYSLETGSTLFFDSLRFAH